MGNHVPTVRGGGGLGGSAAAAFHRPSRHRPDTVVIRVTCTLQSPPLPSTDPPSPPPSPPITLWLQLHGDTGHVLSPFPFVDVDPTAPPRILERVYTASDGDVDPGHVLFCEVATRRDAAGHTDASTDCLSALEATPPLPSWTLDTIQIDETRVYDSPGRPQRRTRTTWFRHPSPLVPGPTTVGMSVVLAPDRVVLGRSGHHRRPGHHHRRNRHRPRMRRTRSASPVVAGGHGGRGRRRHGHLDRDASDTDTSTATDSDADALSLLGGE